jgi:hypothetical protein
MNILETIKNFFLNLWKKVKITKQNFVFYLCGACLAIFFIIMWIMHGFGVSIVLTVLAAGTMVGLSKLIPWIQSKLPDEEK